MGWVQFRFIGGVGYGGRTLKYVKGEGAAIMKVKFLVAGRGAPSQGQRDVGGSFKNVAQGKTVRSLRFWEAMRTLHCGRIIERHSQLYKNASDNAT